MLWLVVIILAYFLLAISAMGDEYLLNGKPNPKNYSFYTGSLGVLILLMIPFVGFTMPSPILLIIGLLAGVIFLIANFFYFTALEKFDLSRVAPAMGAFLPISTFLIIFFLEGSSITSFWQITAFLLLVLGSVLITIKAGKSFSFKGLLIAGFAAFLFSMSFVLSKHLYSQMPFWSALMIMRVGSLLIAMWFIFTKEVRDELFHKKPTFQKKSGLVFVGNQIAGASAYILQSWAVALVPLAFLPFINALEGIKYVFILLFVPVLAKFIPQLCQEKNTTKSIIQKAISIIIICIGLFLIATK
jgi:drug/metabolite transporter (DMT)-like permease